MKLIQGVVNQVNSLKISQRDSLCFELLQYITQNQFLQKNEESCQEVKKVLGQVAHSCNSSYSLNTGEAENRRIAVGGQEGQKVKETPSQLLKVGMVVYTCPQILWKAQIGKHNLGWPGKKFNTIFEKYAK